jgi:hypothetical protein
MELLCVKCGLMVHLMAHLKKYGQMEGHEAVDMTLGIVAQSIMSIVRSSTTTRTNAAAGP